MHLEIFPTNHSCPAGCKHCILSRRPGAESNAPVNPEIVQSFKLLEKLLKSIDEPYEIIYAGPIQSFVNHLKELIGKPELVYALRCAFDPKEASLEKYNKYFEEQATVLHQEFPRLSLKEFSATLYPKNPFRVSEREKRFIVKLFESMTNLSCMKEKRTLKIELHANMIPFKDFVKRMYKKRVNMFQQHDTQLFQDILDRIAIKTVPAMINQNFLFTNWIGLTFSSSLGLGFFDEKFDKNLYLENRIIGHAEYPSDWNQKQIALHQGKTLLGQKVLTNPVFSFAPEGVMIQHSSLYITNPVIWVSHEEFRKLLMGHGTSKSEIGRMATMIIKTNLEFLEKEEHFIPYKKSMQKFAQLRNQKQLQDMFS